MKKFTLLVAAAMISIAASAQIPGMTGLYTFSDPDNLFVNSAPGDAGTGTMKCDGVMKFDPAAEDSNADDMPSEELTDWSVIDGISDKALSLKAFNWLKIWHGIPKNGGGDYVNDFSVLIDVRLTCDTCVYSLLEVNPTPTANGYGSEMEIDNLKLGSVDKPWSTDEIPYSESVMDVDTWYRIVYSAKLGENIKMYVNGVEWNSWEGDIKDGRPAPYGADSDPEDAAMKVGGNNEQSPANNPQRDFDKDIDAIAIFETTLSAEEVASLGGPETDILGTVTGFSRTSGSIDGFSVYPNPASGMIHFSGTGLRTIEVISIAGKVIDRVDLFGSSSMDISSLPKGMYFVKAVDSFNQVAVEKLIVE